MKALISKPTKIRINHVDKDIVTLGTFIPFDNDGEVEQKIVMIINDKEKLWFEIVGGESLLNIHGNAYQIDGYPIEIDTMLSPSKLFDMFGDNPRENTPIPLDSITSNQKNITPKELLDDVQKFIRKYVGLYTLDMKPDDGMYDLLSHWILYTHIYDVWNTCSYIKLMGDFASGKSIATNTIKLLSFCASSAESRLSDAALYRGIHAVGGVKLLDEITLTRADMTQFRDVLKAGIQRDACVELVDKHDHTKIDRFRMFGPKIISGTDTENIDPVLSSRMIEVVMQQAPPKSATARQDIYSDESKEEAREIRDRLYLFRLFFAHEFLRRKKRIDRTKYFKDNDLSNRFFDIYSPLFLISGLVSGKSVTKVLERAALDQMEMRRVEIYCQLDVPILRVLYQNLMTLDNDGYVRMTDTQISNEIIKIEMENRQGLCDKKTMSDKFSPDLVGARLRGMGISKEHRASSFGLQWTYYKRNVLKTIKQKKLDFSWVTMSHLDQVTKITAVMKMLKIVSPLGSYEPIISEEVGFPCHPILQIMEKDKLVTYENGMWLLIK